MLKGFTNQFEDSNTCGKEPLEPSVENKTPPSLMQYFRGLASPFDMHEFSAYWAMIESADLTAKDYSDILTETSFACGEHGKKGPLENSGIRYWLRNELSPWEHGVERTLPSSSVRNISKMLLSGSSLGIAFTPALNENIETRFCELISHSNHRAVDNFTDSVTKTLLSWSRLAHVPTPKTLRAIHAVMPTIIPTSPQRDINLNLRSLAIFDSLSDADSETSSLCKTIATKLLPAVKQHETSHSNQAQYRDAAMWFGFNVQLPPLHKQEVTTSREERRLGYLLDRTLSSSFKQADTYLSKLEKNTDYSFEGENGRILDIEYDGEYHFMLHADDSLQYDGPSIFQSRLAAKIHPERITLRMPWMIFEQICERVPSQLARKALLAKMIEHALKQPAGSALVVQSEQPGNKFTFAPL